MIGLTERQSDALTFIQRYVDERGFSPSYVEIAEGLGVTSKGNVHRLVCGLEKRGAIMRMPDRARSIVIACPRSAEFHLKAILAEIGSAGAVSRDDHRVVEAMQFLGRRAS